MSQTPIKKQPSLRTLRRQQIARWFAAGKPKWRKENETSYDLHVSGDPAWWFNFQGKRASVAGILRDDEYNGWTVMYGNGEELMRDSETVALFDTVDEAKAGFLKAVPIIVEEQLEDMAEQAVKLIDKELGFWHGVLLGGYKGKKARDYLVDRIWGRAFFGEEECVQMFAGYPGTGMSQFLVDVADRMAKK